MPLMHILFFDKDKSQQEDRIFSQSFNKITSVYLYNWSFLDSQTSLRIQAH